MLASVSNGTRLIQPIRKIYGFHGAVMKKKIKQKIKNTWKYAKDHKSLVALAVLIVIASLVYAYLFFPRHSQQFGPDDEQISPQTAQLLQSWHGNVPSLATLFQRPTGGNVNWQQMTDAQREQMRESFQTRMDAFALAFAQASPAQQHMVMAEMKQRFNGGGGPGGGPRGGGGPGGPGGGGGPRGGGPGGRRGAPSPTRAAQGVANNLLSGNPQMSAARNAMRMARATGG